MTGSEGVSIQIQHENNFDCSLLDSFGSFISLASVYAQKLNRNSTVSITRNKYKIDRIYILNSYSNGGILQK